jgi:hypothetical protein
MDPDIARSAKYILRFRPAVEFEGRAWMVKNLAHR